MKLQSLSQRNSSYDPTKKKKEGANRYFKIFVF